MFTLAGLIVVLTVLQHVNATQPQHVNNNSNRAVEIVPGVGRYLVNDQLLTWNDAESTCRSLRGHLAYPESAAQVEALHEILVNYTLSQVHLGFHDQFIENKFYTVTGARISETCSPTWADGYPQGGTTNNCGGATVEGMTDGSCAQLLPSICQQHLWYDYDYIPGYGYYKLHSGWWTWSEAVAVCESEGTHLIVLDSEEELRTLFEAYEFALTWVGITHRLQNYQFVTIFGDLMEQTGFSSWLPGEPLGDNDNFPYLAMNEDGYGLFDAGYPFICKHKTSVQIPI